MAMATKMSVKKGVRTSSYLIALISFRQILANFCELYSKELYQ